MLRRFRFLGRVMAMAMREGYLVPLPVNDDFFSLVCGQQLSTKSLPRPGSGIAGEFIGACADFVDELERVRASEPPATIEARIKECATNTAFGQKFLSKEQASQGMACLCFEEYAGEACFLETGFGGAELCQDGEEVSVTVANVVDFVALAAKFWLEDGIREQVKQFRAGLQDVFPLESLLPFSPNECRDMFCGEETIEWDEKSLQAHVHPVGGTFHFLRKVCKFSSFLIDSNQMFFNRRFSINCCCFCK